MAEQVGVRAALGTAAPLLVVAGTAGLWLAGVLLVLRWAGVAVP